MNEDRRQRVEKLFCEAAGLEPDARVAFLDRACGSDQELRREVESLLAHDSEDQDAFSEARLGIGRDLLASAMQSGALASDGPAGLPAPPIPDVIGHYRILERIGEGGMGTVYAAQQDHPRRRVALKMIRPGAASRSLLRRFRQEAELLGRLQHPGIAQIYEAGMIDTAGGRQPYFAMEYVDGLELRRYAREHDLGTPERLELVARISEAVHHAHQKGIIHRDLKPDNVQVMDAPMRTGLAQGARFAVLGQPKVLDFGVARATDSDIQITTMRTDVGQLIGTIPYMSPEQVTGDSRRLDMRSDIYALGVILYELLSGRLPLDLRSKSIPEAARIIREVEPTPLSSINTVFRGDIDTIVSKALEKDPDRRYQSAGELAVDIRHYLANEPITARPPSTFYQLRKFAKRNRGLVAGLGLAALILIAGTITSLSFAVRARRDEERASANEDRALANEAASRRTAYRLSITAAEALSATDPLQAFGQLEAAPPEYRGWEWRHLSARLRAFLAEYSGDPGPRNAATVARRADGTLVAALARDGAVELILLESGDVWATFRGDSKLATPNLSPDASRLVAVDAVAEKLVIWNVPSGQRVLELPVDSLYLPGGSIDAYYARFSQDGSLIALGSGLTELTIRETATGQVRFRTDIAKPYRNKLAFDVEGKRLAVIAPHNSHLRVFSAAGERIASRDLIGGGISLAFSPDGGRLAVGLVQRWILILDASTLEEVTVLSGHEWWVRALNFSRDGTFLASSSDDGTTRIWELATGETARALIGSEKKSHGLQPVRRPELPARLTASMSLAFSRDNALLAGGSATEARLWAWTHDARHILRGHQSYVYQVAFSPDGTLIASSAFDDTVRLWDPLTGEPLAGLPARAPYNAMGFTPDGTRLIASESSQFAVWDTATGIRLSTPCTASDEALFQTLGHADSHRYRRFARVAVGGAWNAQGSSFALNPNGSLRAEVEHKGEIRIVDAATGDLVDRLDEHDGGPFWSAAFHPNRPILAFAGTTGTVGLWDLARARPLATMRGHVGLVYSVNFSPDATRVVSGGNDGTIMLWNSETHERVAVLRGHEDYVYTVCFSPDGTRLASASGDGTVRIWDSVPPAERWRQIRQAEALRREAEPLVDRLLAELADSLDVADHLRTDENLTDDFRCAALRVLLHRSATKAPGGT